MDIDTWLKNTTTLLKQADVPTARLDALVLLEDAVAKDRSWLLAHPEFELDSKIATDLQQQIKKRALHIPLAYIRGKSEFYGREFLVTPDTLQPRPETEAMIELLKTLKLTTQPIVADIGTGSGCIAITAQFELKAATVYATEINQAALDVAQKNATSLKAAVHFYKGNLLEPLPSGVKLDVLLCNLPYVPNSHTINQSAMQEPAVAIFGGEDGLDLYRTLFGQIQSNRRPEYILAESLPFQHEGLFKIAAAYGYRQEAEQDFIQVFKVA